MGDDGIFFRGFCLALGLVMVGGLMKNQPSPGMVIYFRLGKLK